MSDLRTPTPAAAAAYERHDAPRIGRREAADLAGFEPAALPQRFWDKVDKSDGCWTWNAARSTDGYGHFFLDGKSQKAHRVSYVAAKGPVPSGLVLDHLCRNRLCVNPDHLEPVTIRENVVRGLNLRPTECKKGHVRTEANTRINRDGSRDCRTCQRDRWREYRAKAREAS